MAVIRWAVALAFLLGSTLVVDSSAQARRTSRERLGAAAAPVRLVPVGGGTLSVSGLPDYFGEIRLGAASDGLVVVNRLPLERYLLGLAEVPSDWPSEALKAQAVAARTYALYTLSQPRAGAAAVYGFDICASVECQVFSGAEIVQGADGARWREAVEGTARQTVLYEGAPILARYHSTSGGRTLDNPDAFETEPAYPYLQAVTSTTEEGSPLYRWSVRFRLRDLQRIVERAGLWTSAAGRLTEVRSVPSDAGRHFPDVVLRGPRGRVRLSAEELRSIVRDRAPRLFPTLYPSPAINPFGRLPETFPSNRIEIRTARRLVLVRGRGWGHGVGMSQWGAHGMALRGASYADILGHYYTGVELGPAEDPGAIDVGVAWARSVVDVTGDFRIVDGKGRSLVERALGTWRFSSTGLGTVSIDPPKGYGLPLRVGIVDAPSQVGVGEPAWLTIALSRPARVRAFTRDETFEDAGVRVRNGGRRRIPWLAPLEPGRYEVSVTASTGAQAKRSDVIEIEVVEASGDQPTAEEDRQTGHSAPEDDGSPWPLVAAISFLFALGVIAVTGTIRR